MELDLSNIPATSNQQLTTNNRFNQQPIPQRIHQLLQENFNANGYPSNNQQPTTTNRFQV